MKIGWITPNPQVFIVRTDDLHFSLSNNSQEKSGRKLTDRWTLANLLKLTCFISHIPVMALF